MISEEDALEAARQLAAARGWTWLSPVKVWRSRTFVLFGRRTYRIGTNSGMRGCNVWVTVDAYDGTILEANFIPR